MGNVMGRNVDVVCSDGEHCAEGWRALCISVKNALLGIAGEF